jgi:hypothetical protein
MASSVNHSEENDLSDMLCVLDSCFGSRRADLRNLVDEAVTLIYNLKNGLVREMAEEVAQLVLKGTSETSVKKRLHRNFPSGVSIRDIEEILKIVYKGTNADNLKKAIHFVQIVDSSYQVQAYKALYQDIQYKKQNQEPEMLLLQKKINLIQSSGTVLDEIKQLIDADCCKITNGIIKGIKEKDYSVSIHIARHTDFTLLNENLVTVVREFCTGTLENTMLMMQFASNLPNIENQCLLIDTLLLELENRQLLGLEQGMLLWSFAKFTKDEQINWQNVAESYRKLCTDAIHKLSANKEQFFRHYQKYVEDSEQQKIKNLHKNHGYLQSIVCEFVSFYYSGDLVRTQKLLETVNTDARNVPVGRILNQLYVEMDKRNQLKSFQEFQLFNKVKEFINLDNSNALPNTVMQPFKQLKEKAPACIQKLLWPPGSEATEFQLINKYYNATLGVQTDNSSVVCYASGHKRSNQIWKMTVDQKTSLLTLTHAEICLELGSANEKSLYLGQTGLNWMVKAVDEDHLQIYRRIKG